MFTGFIVDVVCAEVLKYLNYIFIVFSTTQQFHAVVSSSSINSPIIATYTSLCKLCTRTKASRENAASCHVHVPVGCRPHAAASGKLAKWNGTHAHRAHATRSGRNIFIGLPFVIRSCIACFVLLATSVSLYLSSRFCCLPPSSYCLRLLPPVSSFQLIVALVACCVHAKNTRTCICI